MRHPRRIFLARTARLGALAMAGTAVADLVVPGHDNYFLSIDA